MSVVWCLTGKIIVDYMNKPLQGAMLRDFRNKIMGVIPAADPGLGKVKVEQLSKG